MGYKSERIEILIRSCVYIYIYGITIGYATNGECENATPHDPFYFNEYQWSYRVGVEHVTNECNTIGWRSAREAVGKPRESAVSNIEFHLSIVSHGREFCDFVEQKKKKGERERERKEKEKKIILIDICIITN